MNEAARHFRTVKELLAYLAAAHTRLGGVLFRGEKTIFPTSMPGIPRVMTDPSLSFDQKSFLIDIPARLQEWVEERTGGESDDWDMFLQHYGAATDLTDFTEDPRIAAFFAFKDAPEATGRVAILPIAAADRHVELIPFGNFEIDGRSLARPLKQKAWAVRHRPGHPYDFAAPETVSLLGIEWVTFDKVLDDPGLFGGLGDILDPSGDPVAEMMREWLLHCRETAWQTGVDPIVERILKQL